MGRTNSKVAMQGVSGVYILNRTFAQGYQLGGSAALGELGTHARTHAILKHEKSIAFSMQFAQQLPCQSAQALAPQGSGSLACRLLISAGMRPPVSYLSLRLSAAQGHARIEKQIATLAWLGKRFSMLPADVALGKYGQKVFSPVPRPKKTARTQTRSEKAPKGAIAKSRRLLGMLALVTARRLGLGQGQVSGSGRGAFKAVSVTRHGVVKKKAA